MTSNFTKTYDFISSISNNWFLLHFSIRYSKRVHNSICSRTITWGYSQIMKIETLQPLFHNWFLKRQKLLLAVVSKRCSTYIRVPTRSVSISTKSFNLFKVYWFYWSLVAGSVSRLRKIESLQSLVFILLVILFSQTNRQYLWVMIYLFSIEF